MNKSRQLAKSGTAFGRIDSLSRSSIIIIFFYFQFTSNHIVSPRIMSCLRFWLTQGPMHVAYKPGNIIILSQPQLTTWKIETVLQEQHHQVEEDNGKSDAAPSYASVKLSCIETKPPGRQVATRVYMQMSYFNTELDDLVNYSASSA